MPAVHEVDSKLALRRGGTRGKENRWLGDMREVSGRLLLAVAAQTAGFESRQRHFKNERGRE